MLIPSGGRPPILNKEASGPEGAIGEQECRSDGFFSWKGGANLGFLAFEGRSEDGGIELEKK
jgi:hypothetical protein